MKVIITILTSLLLVITTTGSVKASKENTNSSENKIGNTRVEPVSKLVNNGKILSELGYKNISDSEVTSIMVSKDTLFITIKDEALKRIDQDLRNYVETSSKSYKTKLKKGKK